MKVFKEEQRFTQLWLIVLMAVSIIVPITIITKKFLRENTTMTTNELVCSLLIIFLSALIIFVFKLTTKIDEQGIHYQFFPFHFKLKCIKWKEISKAYVRIYDPIGEYGGWGLKGGWSKSKGKAINVSGDIGIQLELKNGKKLLVGTQKEDDVKRVLDTYQSKISKNV